MASAPLTFLLDRLRLDVAERSDAMRLLQTHPGLPAIRLESVVAEVLISRPMTGILVAAAVALFELSRRQDHDLRRAFPWLRRSAGFALASVLLLPMGEHSIDRVQPRRFSLPRGSIVSYRSGAAAKP